MLYEVITISVKLKDIPDTVLFNPEEEEKLYTIEDNRPPVRITSYNVCYTKLLRTRRLLFSNLSPKKAIKRNKDTDNHIQKCKLKRLMLNKRQN